MPTLKAAFGVFSLMFTIVSASYIGIVMIAKSEATSIEKRIMAVRDVDFQHIDGRFDRTDAKLDKIMELVKEK
jgi:hypothetical protein